MSSISKLLLGFAVLSATAFAQSNSGCPQGSYAVINSPDGGSLSVLFDEFVVEAGGNTGLETAVKTCTLEIPLGLPTGYSIGVYKVDYRGFAALGRGQSSELIVDYNLGPRQNGRRFRRKVKGVYDGDFVFTETLGAGQMKRVGCGEKAKLNVSIILGLQSRDRLQESMVGLDSADGAAKGGLIYHFDYKKCR